MSTCAREGCAGHLGKFGSCEDEALYILTLDGGDTGCGDSDWEGYMSLVVLDVDTVVRLEYGDSPAVTVPAGAYTVYTSPSGFVSVALHDTEADALAHYEQWERDYQGWVEDGEEL